MITDRYLPALAEKLGLGSGRNVPVCLPWTSALN